MFTKLLLIMSSFTSVSSTAYIVLVKDNITLSEQMKMDYLRQDIMNNSVKMSTDTIYNFDGKDYHNKDNIIKDELNKNPITVEKTLSDPNKIISNSATNQLDENRVYDTNAKNLVKVYKNELGKAVLPSCEEVYIEGCIDTKIDSKQRALDSYVNRGRFRPKYSYDNLAWFDSVEEAEIAYGNSNYEIGESLFYLYNGQYFNAFNKNDAERLKVMLEPGYRFEGLNEDFNADGEDDIKPFLDSFRYSKSYFMDYFKENFKDYFFTNNKEKENIVQFNRKYKIILKANLSSDNIPQWFVVNDNDNNMEGVEFKANKDNGTLEIIVSKSSNESNFIKHDILLKDLNNVDNWKSEVHHSSNWGIETDTRRTHDYTYELNGQKFVITLETKNDASNGHPPGYNDTTPRNISFSTSFVQNDFIFDWQNRGKFFNKIVDTYNLEKIDSNELINYMHAEQVKQREDEYKIEQFLMDLSLNSKIENFRQFDKNTLFDYVWTKIAPNLIDMTIKNNPVKEDWLYGKVYGSLMQDYSYSFNESNIEFQKNFDSINQNVKPDEDVSFSYQGKNFTTSYKNWKENFYAMTYENGNGIPLQKLYYVYDKQDQQNNADDFKITNYSDMFGENLALTENQAKNIQTSKAQKVLLKRFEAYDSFGKLTVINKSNEDEAAEWFKKQIELDYKLIHKDELKSLKDQQTDVVDLVTSKESYVYKFKAVNGRIMYFKDYKSARAIYENQISYIGGITERNITFYNYSININGKKEIFYYNSNDSISDLCNKIYKLLERG